MEKSWLVLKVSSNEKEYELIKKEERLAED